MSTARAFDPSFPADLPPELRGEWARAEEFLRITTAHGKEADRDKGRSWRKHIAAIQDLVKRLSPNTIHLSKNSVHLKSPVDKNPSVFNI
jgi:hypothetical protein